MAMPSHAVAVKSLNKSPGRRRFVFKTFSQRLEEIDIDVYRSLGKVKAEPSEGSCFFRDCLLEWRELNTAEDFISIYDEMMPLAQTLPLVLFHKEFIISKLLSSLQMKARLSLEPILRLITALSRDLLEDFFPFLPRIAESLVTLLQSGADREPEIMEQIFMSWSYIMMDLQKYFVDVYRKRKKYLIDIVHVLKLTTKLRYYPKDYVQEFMSEAMSFLLRNAPDEKQLIKGIRKIMSEVVKKPLATRKSGVSDLIYYVMRGTSSRLHSRAERVLRLLMDNSTFDVGDKINKDSDTVVEVVSTAFQRLCTELDPKELNLLWTCLYQEITDCVANECFVHLSRLISLLISTIQISNGRHVFDFLQVLELVGLLVQTYIEPYDNVKPDDHRFEVVDKVLQLMLSILHGLQSSNDMAIIYGSLQWDPVFKLRNSSLLIFIRELLLKDPCIVYAFRVNILSALNDLIETSEEEVTYLLLSFCERLREKDEISSILDGPSEAHLRVHSYLHEAVFYWTKVINDVIHGVHPSNQIHEAKLALLWGIVRCYPHFSDFQENTASLMDLIDALDRLLMIEADNLAGLSRHTWLSLLGAVLDSYYKLYDSKKSGLDVMRKFLHLAKRYKSSLQVLSAVADYLDSVHGLTPQADTSCEVFHPELKVDKAMDAVAIFADNLCHSNKEIRLSTLRILCHYEPLSCEISKKDNPVEKRTEAEEVAQACHTDNRSSNVLQLLFGIESTPLSISTSRKVVLLISRIQMDLSAGRISAAYVPLVLNGIIGILHSRFSYLWNPAIECLEVLLREYVKLLWDQFVGYLEQYQSTFLTSHDPIGSVNTKLSKSSDLVGRFILFSAPVSESTPCATVLSSLLQSLQRIPAVIESRSRHIVPLFLKFLGYNCDDHASVESFDSHVCKGKEWKGVLKEWLNLLKLMRNMKSFYQSQFLKEVLQNRLLDENDADIQMKALDCLLNWKDDFLLPYHQHLKNLIDSKSLREELTTWSISKESNLIEEEHRAYLVPLVIRIMMPKVRKLKTLASRKHTSMHQRKAVLGFIAQLNVDELPLFFALLIKPLQIVSKGNDDNVSCFWTSLVIPGGKFGENFLSYFTMDNIAALSWKKRYGFLHVIEDVLGVFDEFHVGPFLDLLMGCVVRVLGSCTSSLHIARGNGSSPLENNPSANITLYEKNSIATDHVSINTPLKQFKDLRSLCLKIVYGVLNKYEDHDFGCEFWDLFFISVKPLIDNFKQEGSNSEKPSSLFSCFVAMSESQRLVSLLSREKCLVADIFSILTVPTASDAILSCVLKFIENLLNLHDELDDEDTAVKDVILQNLEVLICSLHCLFQSDTVAKRKLMKCPGGREIRIFKLLSKFIKDSSLATKYLDILLPVLSNRAQNSDACVEALQAVQDIVPVLGSESTTKILKVVSPLLISVDLDLRLCVCNLLGVLAETDPSIFLVAKLVHELNAISVMKLNDVDYDTRIIAYEKITVDFFSTVREEHALVILSQCVSDMVSSEEFIRHRAFGSLVSFVEFSALIVGQEVRDQSEMPEAMITSDNGCWTRCCIQRIVNKFLLKHVGYAMNRGASVMEWVSLLRVMVLKLPEVSNLGSFKSLCNEDSDIDFFKNISHLQKHRRARALSRFRNVISKSNVSLDIANKVFVPLFLNMLFDVQDGKGEHVRSACIDALASICGKMEWKSYYALLSKCFREIATKPDKQKLLLRLICSIFDQFHFVEECSIQEAKDSLSSIPDVGTGSTTSLAISHTSTGSSMMTEIQICLNKTILPKIQKLLSSDSDKVNVNISLSALKLLKLLPEEIMDSQLPSIIHRISNFLKNRLESIRDEARSALAACLKELGLEYLQFIVRVLRTTLKRGYELHVLGYTLNFILSKNLQNLVCGKLDHCLEDLLSVVENDILGDVAEEKEVEKIASKMKETRKRKSFETLKLIAQGVTFKSNALKLLSPVTAHLQKHMTPKVKAKIESMLNHIAAGIDCNPSVDQTDLFIFIYGLIEDGINEDNHLGENSSITGSSKQCITDGDVKRNSSHKIVGSASHIITVFALGLLLNRIKNVKWDKNDELLSMLDPFINLLGNCLSSKYGDILSASLKCLAPLVRLPLPSLGSQADKIKVALLDIAQSSLSTSSPLMQSCLTLLTVLLRSTKITLSSDQLHLLIQFPLFVDLEKNPSFVALSLLKSIVNRKLVVHEIYDVVTRVAELMVKSQVEPIRKKCSQIFLQFLLDYHLSEKRLHQHLDFLLANLSYEHPTGREAVLELLHAIMIKFPKSIVDDQSKAFFVHLVVCLANDHDNKVRAMAGTAIKLLLGHISPHSLNSIVGDTLDWYSNKKQQLWSTAAQVLGLLVEVMKKGFQKNINIVLPEIRKILQLAADAVADGKLDSSDEATVPFWKEAYYSLVMLEKILHQFPDLCLERDTEDVWGAICELLLHPHTWLRNISNRLVAFYFAIAKTSIENDKSLLGIGSLMRPSRLFMISVSLCCQLKTQLNDDAANNVITQNLVFAICTMGKLEHIDPYSFWCTLEDHEQACFLKAFQLLDSKKGRGMFLSLTSVAHDYDDQCKDEDLRYFLVSNLLKRMGKIALQMEAIQMKIVFNSFRKISSQISPVDCQHYAYHMLLPLFKVCEGFAGKVVTDNLKQLAQEVCGCIRDNLGSQNFAVIYNQIRKNLQAKREKRKQGEKVMAVVNPMRNAKRKLRIAEKHRANKKRKLLTMKMGRWMR